MSSPAGQTPGSVRDKLGLNTPGHNGGMTPFNEEGEEVDQITQVIHQL